jgi:transposase
LDGILWICRTGAPWRDLPAAFGKWNSVWKQFRRWCESGVWDLLLQALADSGGALDMLQMIDSTIVRAHRCAASEKTEEQNQALGRSRGGFSTRIHVRCNAAGLPIGIVLSEGEAHDVTAYEGLMQQRDSDPGAMLADKGYDSDAICQDLWDSGVTPEIPTRGNRKVQYSVSKPLYATLSRIECFIGRLKEQRRIAARYDKLATSFIGFVFLGCIRTWARLSTGPKGPRASRDRVGSKALAPARAARPPPFRVGTLAAPAPYADNPEALANLVYAGRMGNGDAASGDGWRFRGEGLIELTGRELDARFAVAFGKTPDDAVAWLLTPPGAATSACWYWSLRSLNPLVDVWDIAAITRLVNGGLTSLQTRVNLSNLALAAIGALPPPAGCCRRLAKAWLMRSTTTSWRSSTAPPDRGADQPSGPGGAIPRA